MAARLLEHHVDRASDGGALKAWRCLDQRLQRGEPLALDLLVDLVLALGAGVPGRGEYLKEKRRRNSTSRISARVVLEIGIGLARKADDEIGRERDVGPRGAQAPDDVEIVGRLVAAVHRFQHAVGARTAPADEEGHELRQGAMRVDQILRPCPRDGWSYSAAAQRPACAARCSKRRSSGQSPAVGVLAAIGVDVLADQRDLAHARVDEAVRLGDDFGDPREISAPRV